MKKTTLTSKVLLVLLLVLLAGASSINLLRPFDSPEQESETTPENQEIESGDDQLKIVNKQIPSGYVMGNPIDIELMSGMSVLFIRNPSERVSFRFTAKFSGEARAVAFNALSSRGEAKVRAGLQEDNEGAPKGEWLNGSGFGITQTPSTRSFLTVDLQEKVPITEGRIYHLVIETAEALVEDRISIITYMANGFSQPYDEDDPDIVWKDPMIDSLSYDGESWREENMWPIFVVEYSDGKREGQPYSLAAPWVIHGSTYVGQTIIPSSTYKIGSIAFVVALKGEPTDKLYYEIRGPRNEVLAKGTFAEASQLTFRKKWIEVPIPPITLKAGELYRVVLLSPGTDLENPYHLYGHEFCYDSAIGYGGPQHRLTSSYNAGSTWIDNLDADAIFKLTTTD